MTTGERQGAVRPYTAMPAKGMMRTVEGSETEMYAEVGDRLVIKGHHYGEPNRDAEILEVRGKDRRPPFLVRWSDDGHVGLIWPGSDAIVEHRSSARAAG